MGEEKISSLYNIQDKHKYCPLYRTVLLTNDAKRYILDYRCRFISIRFKSISYRYIKN
jgi:hypothetical protein